VLPFVALLPGYGCAPRAANDAQATLVSEEWVAYSDVDDQRHVVPSPPDAASQVQSPTAQRVRELEQQLAERDRQIAAVQNDLQAVGDPPPAPVAAGGEAQPAADPSTTAAARSGAAPEHDMPASTAPAAAPAEDPSLPASEPRAASETKRANVPAAPATAPVLAANDPRLIEAQRRIARLQQQLSAEVKRRHEVEAEMTRLLQETSAGPFDKAANVVEEHLRAELGRARKEIRSLRATLTAERRERDDLERRYAELQAQVQAAAKSAPPTGVPNEEVEALKARQHRVLASIQQDLAASKRQEAELRQALEQAQGPNGASVAEEVSGLRSQNGALQMRLDEEHLRNRELAAKLQLATRVTDLIYKMQSRGIESVAAVPLPEPH
jgi:hypothetical protein